MTQKRESSRAVIEVEFSDFTNTYLVRRLVIESFSSPEKRGDYGVKELIIDDLHVRKTKEEVNALIEKALSYLEV